MVTAQEEAPAATEARQVSGGEAAGFTSGRPHGPDAIEIEAGPAEETTQPRRTPRMSGARRDDQ